MDNGLLGPTSDAGSCDDAAAGSVRTGCELELGARNVFTATSFRLAVIQCFRARVVDGGALLFAVDPVFLPLEDALLFVLLA